MSDPEVFDIRLAACFLRVHEQTVRKLARRAALPAFKVGRDWRFRKEALVQWADARGTHARDSTGGCSVLVIDDEELVCKSTAALVKSLGCRVRWATSGAQGLALVAEETPDLILLDLVMPGMDGPQLLAELRKTHPTLPVAIVTGYPDSDLMKQASQHGPLMMLPKPASRTLLERTVQLVVRPRGANEIA